MFSNSLVFKFTKLSDKLLYSCLSINKAIEAVIAKIKILFIPKNSFISSRNLSIYAIPRKI